jgi:DNA-binding NtrC family response regulator
MASRILLVDDNEPGLSVLTEDLSFRMPEVLIDTATYTADALAKAASFEYAVIVCNACMHQMDVMALIPVLYWLCPETIVIRLALLNPLAVTLPGSDRDRIVPFDVDELQGFLRVALKRRQRVTDAPNRVGSFLS